MYKVHCDKVVDYWVPKHKYEAVEWLVKHRGYETKVLNKLLSKVVFAIYHKIRSS